MSFRRTHLIIDLFIIAVSVLLSVLLIKTGLIAQVIGKTTGLRLTGSFIAGILFTSAFTTALATAAFIEIAPLNSIYLMAILGGLGALFGDIIIFSFVKNRFSSDIKYLLSLRGRQRLYFIFHRRAFRWLSAFFGALIIASPLPDEIGIALLGLAKIRFKHFAAASFILNTLGILMIGLIAKAII